MICEIHDATHSGLLDGLVAGLDGIPFVVVPWVADGDETSSADPVSALLAFGLEDPFAVAMGDGVVLAPERPGF